MKRPLTIYVLIIVAIGLLLSACGGEDVSQSNVVVPARRKIVKKVEPAKEPEMGDVVLAGSATRNPFLSFVAEQLNEAIGMKSPLQCCDVNAFKLIAVIIKTDVDDPKALIQAPDGKRHYLGKGDLIGLREGRVVAMTGKSVVVEEIVRDIDGELLDRQRVELSLPLKEFKK